jgi:hypothetical protein
LLLALIGSNEGFRPSLKWINDVTGMSQPAYSRVKQDLIRAGILQHDKQQNILFINFDLLWSLENQFGVFKRKRNLIKHTHEFTL